MDTKNPPVHPCVVTSYEDSVHYTGISLRDYYAGIALQGLISNTGIVDDMSSSVPNWLAIKSYLIADEMLKQRLL